MDMHNIVGTFEKWAKEYGAIVINQLGPFKSVVLNDPVLIKDAFSREVFVPRPLFWAIKERTKFHNNTTGD
jgi:hypothetical protein